MTLLFGLAWQTILLLEVLLAQATPSPTQAGIPPVVWELVTYTEAGGEPVAIRDPTRYTLQFLPDGDLAARLDCNRGRGSYTAAAGVLTLTQLAATRMACPPDSEDAPFARILQDVTAYQIDPDGYLILRGAAGELRLRPA